MNLFKNFQVKNAEKHIKYYSNDGRESWEFRKIIRDEVLLNIQDKPSSLFIRSQNELNDHKKFFQDLIKKHSIIARSNGMREGMFPFWCCGKSCDNIIINACNNGYEQIITVRNRSNDHDYNILPFVMNGAQQCLLIDPTYKQLATEELIKNKGVLIKNGSKWEYKTKRANGEDLYPETFITLHDIQENTRLSYRRIENKNKVQAYIEECFTNPIYKKNV